MGGCEPEELFGKILELTPAHSLAIGIGNIGGTGGKLLAHVREVGGAGGAARPQAKERGGKA
jgi:hypothetical protein